MNSTSLTLFAAGLVLAAGATIETTYAPTPPLADIAQAQATQANAQQDTAILVATMTGPEVVGGGQEEAWGSATFTLKPGAREVCYNILVRDIQPTQIHIHKGKKGENGPPVVQIPIPQDSTSVGCAEAETMLISAMISHPRDYYVNVHSMTFPKGAMRGQLWIPQVATVKPWQHN